MNDMDEYGPTCMTETWPKARKIHRCCECRRGIKPGEKYQRISGIWDGQPLRFKTCAECADIAARFRHYLEYEDLPPFGELFEEMKEAGVTAEELPCIPKP